METSTDRQWNSGVGYSSICERVQKERDWPLLLFTYKTRKLHISGILAPSSSTRGRCGRHSPALHMAEVGRCPGTLRERQNCKEDAHLLPYWSKKSLHGQPYPAAPQQLLHVDDVDGQRSLQFLAQPLGAPAVRAVHGHAQQRHQQEEAGEEGQVRAGGRRLVGARSVAVWYFMYCSLGLSEPHSPLSFPSVAWLGI